ncbi:hypothetical protein E2C01_000159 [Portunus trituberculatus]|uniref:Uncharacterized protein n=1 Tax=Portunus trituberculatus TaxID=210409 RepID=A0A5B7CE68_PORTR|nr:hypothetical protein [Portunus trituberculatus]
MVFTESIHNTRQLPIMHHIRGSFYLVCFKVKGVIFVTIQHVAVFALVQCKRHGKRPWMARCGEGNTYVANCTWGRTRECYRCLGVNKVTKVGKRKKAASLKDARREKALSGEKARGAAVTVLSDPRNWVRTETPLALPQATHGDT